MRPRILRIAALLLPLVTVIASCAGDPTGTGTAGLRLANAERRWNEAALASYSFKSTINCFCLDTYRGPMLVTVRQGTVTSVIDVASGAARPLDFRTPIDMLFGLVRTELSERPELLKTAFDSKLGFPTLISYGEQALDGGGVITISDVVAVP